MTIAPDQNSRAASYACGHSDTAENVIGDPPYAVQIPSQGGRLCPTCFLRHNHEEHFLENEQRLNLGKLEGAPYDVWFSMLLRQRQVLRYEAQIRILYLSLRVKEGGGKESRRSSRW